TPPPFPFVGAGPGRARDTWNVFVVFRDEPAPAHRERVEASVPEIVRHQIDWEARLLRCRSTRDVEYDIRLQQYERKGKRGNQAIERAYDETNDAVRSPKIKQWVPACRALDAWLLEVHADYPIAFCLKDNVDADGAWHVWSTSRLRDVFLPE